MYKQLIEDVTNESAAEAIAQWRRKELYTTERMIEEYEFTKKLANPILESSDVKELVVVCIHQARMQAQNDIDRTIADITTGILLGFKVAMYLHEQRELATMETKISKMDIVDDPNPEIDDLRY